MKYIWIVILALVYIIWSISVIKDIIDAVKYAHKHNCGPWYDYLNDDTIGWLVFTISSIGLISLIMFIMEVFDHGN